MQLLPRDEKFFDLLLDQARIALDASRLLTTGMTFASGGTAQKIRELENKGDEALRNIYRRLHKTFITPVDPEDVQALASRIDEVLDHLDAVAYRFEAYGVAGSAAHMREIAGMVQGCIESMAGALEALQRDGVQEADALIRMCEEINRREFETETRVRELVRDLFASEKDPIELIKKKEIYELLESTADCCENVADVLEAIAVKNS
jgi:predicted phosphate transport protein (TIGR00153 family)